MIPGVRGHKYRAKAVTIDGKRFPSKAEAKRFLELQLLERAGLIRELELQPRFPLFTISSTGARVPVQIGRRQACYVADFSYTDAAGRTIVEDVKGHDLPIGKLKRAIVKASYGIDVEVIKR